MKEKICKCEATRETRDQTQQTTKQAREVDIEREGDKERGRADQAGNEHVSVSRVLAGAERVGVENNLQHNAQQMVRKQTQKGNQ